MTSPGFSKIGAISASGGSVNEDIFGENKNYAWVLDGVTGHREEPKTPAKSDGKWYVEQMDKAFRKLSRENYSNLSSFTHDSLELVRDQYRTVANEEPTGNSDMPAAAGVLLRRVHNETVPDQIEYLILGDCTLLIEKNFTVVPVTDKRVAPKEQEQIEAMQRAFADGAEDVWEARKQVEDIFLRNKNNMNSPESYWMFGLDPSAVDMAFTGKFDISEGVKLHLMTDGFSCLVDTYKIYVSWEEALNRIKSNSHKTVLEEIREIEESDSMLQQYPRTKPSDDATMLSLQLSDAQSMD